MKLVTNTSPLIFLAKIGKLSLLKEVSLMTTEAVLSEIKKGELKNLAIAEIIQKFLEKHCKVAHAEIEYNLENVNIAKAEKSVIALAKKENAVVLMDERRGRKTAKLLGLKVVGTIGILAEARIKGKISRAEFNRLVISLIKEGFYIDEALLAQLLQNGKS